MNTLVVIGEAELAGRAAGLVPSFRVLGANQDQELSDPATSLAHIGRLLESGDVPEAVLCEGHPGFSVLCQLRSFPPHRCLIVPSTSVWPVSTLQALVEASGMTFLRDLDSLPQALLGQPAPGVMRPGREEESQPAAVDGEGAASRLRTAQQSAKEARLAGLATANAADFGWSKEVPIQVPPPPVALNGDEVDGRGMVLEAGGDGFRTGTAYLPSDLLRPLRLRED